MALACVGSSIIVKPIAPPSGVQIPSDTKSPTVFGEIVIVGPEQTELSVGDVIAYGEFAGIKLLVGGEDRVALTNDEWFPMYNKI